MPAGGASATARASSKMSSASHGRTVRNNNRRKKKSLPTIGGRRAATADPHTASSSSQQRQKTRPTTSPTRSNIHHNLKWRRRVDPTGKSLRKATNSLVVVQHDGSWQTVHDDEKHGDYQEVVAPETWDQSLLSRRFPHLAAYEMEIVALHYVEGLWRQRSITVDRHREMRKAILAELQQRLKEQLVLCQPRTALEGVALHDKVQADARTICATLVLSQKETCNLLAACSKCAEILQRRSSNFKWQMHQSARKIQCRARIFLARRLIRRQRKVRLRSRRMEERRRKREAAAAERAARAKARKAAWQTQLETGAAVSSEADEDVHLRRISSVRQKEEQRQAILNQRAKMLVELSKTSRWKIARESAPSTSNTVEAKAVRLQHKKKLAKQRVVERERRRRALRERAHERDIARRQKLTCVELLGNTDH
eukprot:INCI18092.4.p1 GENE.INCI18092.4~~INCI18092.4.p1  ORF type:complete len:483 (+),score=69.64 INCI18092.4:173-1450(+)